MKAVLVGLALYACSACGGKDEVKIDRIDPSSGAMSGEQPVRIHGKNFRTDIGYTVYFGAKKATTVTILDETTLLVTTPAYEQAAKVDLRIVADDGAAFRIPNAFRFEDMSGSVVEQLGEKQGTKKGNLVY